MSDQQQMDAPARREMTDQTYTVLIEAEETVITGWRGEIAEGGGEGHSEPVMEERLSWVEAATVTVPARTLRKTVVEKALKDAGITPGVGETMRVRVLDAQSAAPFSVGAVQPPPVLEIGEPA